jgi:hypothetical protein
MATVLSLTGWRFLTVTMKVWGRNTAQTDLHIINPLLFLFKSLLPGQEDCIFFSGHLNLHAKPETGIPYRGKNYNN